MQNRVESSSSSSASSSSSSSSSSYSYTPRSSVTTRPLPFIFHANNAAFASECERWLYSPTHDLRPAPLPCSYAQERLLDEYMDKKRKRVEMEGESAERKKEKREIESEEIDVVVLSPTGVPMTVRWNNEAEQDCYIFQGCAGWGDCSIVERPRKRANPGTDVESPVARRLRLPAPMLMDEPPNRNISVKEWWEESDDEEVDDEEIDIVEECPPTAVVLPLSPEVVFIDDDSE